MRMTCRTALAACMLLFGMQQASAAAQGPVAMGPNPGGRLGEDMPFHGDDVIRRAPAAMKERNPPPSVDHPSAAVHRCPLTEDAPAKDAPRKEGQAKDDCKGPEDAHGSSQR